MGVPAWRANTLEEFNTALAASLSTTGPSLIEAVI
jgi:thiamine pyrophosphate-dependent acetolactate synthase large subunit-like protein